MIFPPSSLSAERRGMKEQALFRPEAAGPLIRGRWTDPSFNSWYLSILATTPLFRPVKVHQKVPRFATNRPKFRVLYAYILKATPAWKKSTPLPMLAVLTNISYACFRANNQFNIHKCVAFEAFRWSKCSRQEKEINRTAEQDIHPIFAFKPSIGPLPCGLFFAGQPY